jgi:hypothetical protein
MNRSSLVVIVLALAGCQGSIELPSAEQNVAVAVGVDGTCSGVAQPFVPRRVRRLTPAEYQATVVTLLGASQAPAVDFFPADPAPNGYVNRSDSLRMSGALTQGLWDAAPGIAAQVAQTLMVSPPCATTGASAETCARQMLSSAAAKVYRRPLEADEIDSLLEVYRVGIVGSNFAAGLTLALQVVVQSAGLLFHTELGDGTGRLTPYEVTEQLAYLLTGAPPDAQLSALAATGALSASARQEQARRLLALPSARKVLGGFGAQWLEVANVATVNRDAQAYPQWPALRGKALDETRSFFSTAVLDDEAKLSTLFTAQWSTADATLAAFYGAAGAGARVTLPEGQRSGVLTQASVMAAHSQLLESSPTKRGHFVRMRLLCQQKRLAPPKDLMLTLPPPSPTSTTRQRFEGHSSNASCQGCHKFMDPIGFGFESYDATGRFRTTDNSQRVDATGNLVGTDIDGDFDGAVALGQKLAGSTLARDCFAQHWFEYAMGEPVDDANPTLICGVRQSSSGFTRESKSVRELILEMVGSDLFVTRAPSR